MYQWLCPKCGTIIEFPTVRARELAQEAGGCQGCRAHRVLYARPALTGVYLDFFARTGEPTSDSWKHAVPPELLEVYGFDPPGLPPAAVHGLFNGGPCHD